MDKPSYLNILRCKHKALLLGLLCLCAGLAGAQVHTFAYMFKEWGGQDIAEDNKNGYVLMLGDKITRIDPFGKTIWSKDIYGFGEVRLNRFQPKQFNVFGVASSVGGFAFKALDYHGNILEETFRRPSDEKDTSRTANVVYYDEQRRQYVVAGWKSLIYFTSKLQYWIAGFDEHGKMLWENSWYDKGKSRCFIRIVPNATTRGYLLEGYDEDVTDYGEIFTTDSMGRLLTRNFIDSCSPTINSEKKLNISCITPFRDSLFLVATYKPCDMKAIYYVLNKFGKPVRKYLDREVYNYHIPQKNGNTIIAGGADLAMLDTNLNLIWKQENIFGDYPDYSISINKIYPSRDGGFYGIANGMGPGGPSQETDVVFVFKTDSLGRINPKPAYSEWDRPMMLQPNPARGKLRIAIPYYFGNIEAEFYNLQGQLLQTQTRNESDYFDISRLKIGIYMVKARNPQTGERRNMKLVVE